MKSRSSRYETEKDFSTTRVSRMEKNKYLYDDINNKIGYEDISSLDTQTRIDLSELSNFSRENYQKTKDYREILKTPTFNENSNVLQEVPKIKETKIYDINSILEQAKMNRKEPDELERKRKLKNSDLNEIDSTKNEYSNISSNVDEDELKDLINTITSKELIDEVNKVINDSKDDSNEKCKSFDDNECNINDIESFDTSNLFDDLMDTKTNMSIQDIIIEDIELTKNIERKKDDESTQDLIDSFYTKSMDLSENDFELSDELEEKRNKKTGILVALCVIILLAAIGFGVYLLLVKYHIL